MKSNFAIYRLFVNPEIIFPPSTFAQFVVSAAMPG